MGWSILNKPPAEGWQAFLDNVLNGGASVTYKVLKSAIGTDGNYYAAVSRTEFSSGSMHIYAAVALIEGASYKMMSEGMHPYYYACPAEVLAALGPTTDPGALIWRARCAERAGAAA